MIIPDVILIKPRVFKDSRGYFLETYKKSDFESFGINCNFIQDNFSCSEKNVLRGLHFQQGDKAQGKLVRVTKGSGYDVAVDIRESSPTYGRYVSEVLSDENHHMLWIPPGLAHGFLALENNTQLHYKCTHNEYEKDAERTMAWNDPAIDISWPLVGAPIVSEKDQEGDFSFKKLLKND